MANGFTITQMNKAHVPHGQTDWLYEFNVSYNGRDWYFPVMVSSSVPSANQLAQAKSQLKAFVSALNHEVQAY